MIAIVQAVYQDGVFRPTSPIPDLREGITVQLTVNTLDTRSDEGEKSPLSSKELRALIRSRNPGAEEVSEELWEELEKSLQIAMSNVRDPERMRQGAEEMDRISQEIYRREGLLDVAVPYLRESRDNE